METVDVMNRAGSFRRSCIGTQAVSCLTQLRRVWAASGHQSARTVETSAARTAVAGVRQTVHLVERRTEQPHG